MSDVRQHAEPHAVLSARTAPPRRWPRRVAIGLAGAPVGLVALLLLRSIPGVVESIYSAGLYPPLAALLASTSGLVPICLTDIVALGLVALLIASPVVGAVRERRRGARRLVAFGVAAGRVAGELGWVWLVFMLAFGLNYARPRPVALFDLSTPVGPAREKELVAQIGETVDRLRATLDEDDQGVARVDSSLRELDARITALQTVVLDEANLPRVSAGRVKTPLLSPLLLRWGVSGVYGPLSGEPNVVLPAPPTRLPFVIAHERAHLSGYAWEEAASFVALLTLWHAEEPELQYSGWLTLWSDLGRGGSSRSPAVQRDLRAIGDFVRRHTGREAPRVMQVYDAYLRAHGVSGGRRSYGRAADLALRYLAARGSGPDQQRGERLEK